jgi:hypothetical protein
MPDKCFSSNAHLCQPEADTIANCSLGRIYRRNGTGARDIGLGSMHCPADLQDLPVHIDSISNVWGQGAGVRGNGSELELGYLGGWAKGFKPVCMRQGYFFCEIP